MSTKHTPGPWKQHEENPRVIVSTSDEIMSLLGLDVDGTAIVYSEADAKLCATAPELLEALQVLVNHAKEAHPHFEDARGQRDIAAAEEAITKATQ